MTSMQCQADDWQRLLSGHGGAPSSETGTFALLYRPEAGSEGVAGIDVLRGPVQPVDRIKDLVLSTPREGQSAYDVLALLPYRQLVERGLSCHDDGRRILALRVQSADRLTPEEAKELLPGDDVRLAGGAFTPDDDRYAEIVSEVLTDEIGAGAGANFVIHRTFTASVLDDGLRSALALFRRLLESERGTYWTFMVHTGAGTFVGASPERHVTFADGVVTMNPISGTFRYPEGGPDVSDVLRFLSDQKEAEELYMVVDEELKMMARLCEDGGRLVGPRLKPMAHLAHTEYLLKGRSGRSVHDILTETMFAPTVTGSPLANATRVIARHEQEGRSFYSGVAALIGHDRHGRTTLDSSIMIRTAEISEDGVLRIGVGATLVRESEPASEVAETEAKARGLLAAASGDPGRAGAQPGVVDGLAGDERIRALLAERNGNLSRFWLAPGDGGGRLPAQFAGVRALLVDAEDDFTGMLAHQLSALGLEVRILSHRRVDSEQLKFADVVVLGPGPGDPTDEGDQRIGTLRRLGRTLLEGRVPFVAICLGHQVVSSLLGLAVTRLSKPNQGAQVEIDLFGRREQVGFYNSFTARCPSDVIDVAGSRAKVKVARDSSTGAVHALRGPGFASVQFHPESVLTRNGQELLGDILGTILDPAPWTSRPALQQPDWPPDGRVDSVRQDLAGCPGLVAPEEIRELAGHLSAVAGGRGLVLQLGDCAESLERSGAGSAADNAVVLTSLGDDLAASAGCPVVRVGRIGGQLAKPRSRPTEVCEGVVLPAFRGHLVNSDCPTEAGRVPDPDRMRRGYRASAEVHAELRACRQVAPSGHRRGSGPWSSHEALVLDYEGPLVRTEPASGWRYLASTHFPWVGDRTRQPTHAHVALLASVGNPLACKVGPTAGVEEILAVVEALDPERTPGRLTLVARMGSDRVAQILPPFLQAVRDAGHPVIWLCDPMHGNTIVRQGRKTRVLADVISEVRQFRDALAACDLHAGGLHLETATDAVTECLGAGVEERHLPTGYTSLCDPRLNLEQTRLVLDAWHGC